MDVLVYNLSLYNFFFTFCHLFNCLCLYFNNVVNLFLLINLYVQSLVSYLNSLFQNKALIPNKLLNEKSRIITTGPFKMRGCELPKCKHWSNTWSWKHRRVSQGVMGLLLWGFQNACVFWKFDCIIHII